MKRTQRTRQGILLFYTRDSGGKHETTPGEYVRTAIARAEKEGLAFTGTPKVIEEMMRNGASQRGDIFLDFDVKGNLLSRPGLDGLFQRIQFDRNVSHVFIPRRDRLARPDHAVEGMQLEIRLRTLGVTLIFMDRVIPPLNLGSRDSIGDIIVSLVDYDQAGKDLRVLAEKSLFAQLMLAKAGFSTGGRAPYGFRRWLAKIDGQLVREVLDSERVRMAGHHVVWIPVAEDHPEMLTIRRILESLEVMPASRLAALLTAEGSAAAGFRTFAQGQRPSAYYQRCLERHDDHNQVDWPRITNVALDVLRQKLLSPRANEKLKARLQELAMQEKTVDLSAAEAAKKRSELRQVEQDRTKVERNMAMANSSDQYQAMAKIFDELTCPHA